MPSLSDSGAFAVYCGGGLYLDARFDAASIQSVSVVRSPVAGCAMSRARAVSVCHAARRAGFRAWVVRSVGAA